MALEVHFLRPLWFLALVPMPFLLWRLARMGNGARAWHGLVDAHLLEHLLVPDESRLRRFPVALMSLGWILAVAALAGPVWERLPQPVFQTDAQRVIVLDLSGDMNARDLPPSRLARAKFEVLDMLQASAEGQTALLVYGAEPFLVSPLTRDADTISAQVPDLETDLMPVRGPKRTDLALEEAGDLLRRAGSLGGDILLVTGSLERPREAGQVASRLRAGGYRVSVLGVGTDEGAPVSLPDGGLLTDERGAISMPRLRPDQLRSLAAAGGGEYVGLAADDSDTRALITREPSRSSERVAEQDARADRWREEGPWLLLILLPLAATAFRRGWLSPLALILLLLPHPPSFALEWDDLWWRRDQQGGRAFSAGNHELAAERFGRQDWRAAAQYESGDYQRALETLAGLPGPDAAYNRGNAWARLGDFPRAIQEYEQVLARDPAYEDARHNRDLLHRLLEQQRAQEQAGQAPRSQGEPDAAGGRQDPDGSQNPSAGQGPSDPPGADNSQADSERQDGEAQDNRGAGGGKEARDGQSKGDTADQSFPVGDGAGSDAQNQDQQALGGGEPEPASNEPQQGRDPSGRPVPGEQDSSHALSGAPERQWLEGSQAPGSKDGSPRGLDQEEALGAAAAKTEASSGGRRNTREAGREPGLDDLYAGAETLGGAQASSVAEPSARGSEDLQATEHMLRRVPDDPGGLLRQRFLLQHLRRSGRLP